MIKIQKGEGVKSLRDFLLETGLTQQWAADNLDISVNTLRAWLRGRNPDVPRHDGMLLRAMRDLRREYAAGIVKAKVVKDPVCPWCGELLPITPDGRRIKSDHTCELTGYRHILTKRAPDLAYRALTPNVRAE